MIEVQIVSLDPAAGADNYSKTMVAVPPSHHKHLLHVIFRLQLHDTDLLIYIYTEREIDPPTPIGGVDNLKRLDS